jgi:hypothetical protein
VLLAAESCAGHSNNLWVEFSSSALSSGLGFQLTALSVEEELGYLVDAVINSGAVRMYIKYYLKRYSTFV